jgi:hypothetical protein
MLLIGCHSGQWRFRHTAVYRDAFRARTASCGSGNVLAKRPLDATHRSRLDRMLFLRRVRFFSCRTIAIACADTHPSASTIAFSDAKSRTRAESYTGTNAHTHSDANTASSIHADWSCARRRNPNPNW